MTPLFDTNMDESESVSRRDSSLRSVELSLLNLRPANLSELPQELPDVDLVTDVSTSPSVTAAPASDTVVTTPSQDLTRRVHRTLRQRHLTRRMHV